MAKNIDDIILDRIASGKDAIDKRLTLAEASESDAVRGAVDVARDRAAALFEALDYLTDEEDAAARPAASDADERTGDLPFDEADAQ